MRVGSLFSGIGGLDLGLERAGMSVAWQCEIDPYCRTVLAHHWPGVACYDDIRAIGDFAERVDLICGGFPCQPVSLAGKGLAQEDPRWLWPEFARVVGLLRPRYVLVENVPGLTNRGLGIVLGDLAEMGYDAEWQIVSAASVGAPHLRERLFVVAYPARDGLLADTCGVGGATGRELGVVAGSSRGSEEDGEQRQRSRDASDGGGAVVADSARDVCRQPEASRPVGERAGAGSAESGAGAIPDPNCVLLDWSGSFREGRRPELADGDWWLLEPEVGRVADGVPGRVAQLRALGNAVVPQVAEFVGRLILEAEGVARAA